MIKFFGLIPRRSDISAAEFHDHYRHPHGTLGLQMQTYRSYVQSHQIDSPLLGPDQTRFEAVAEVWFDTVEDAVGLAEDPHYLEQIKPDERNFVDLDKLEWIYTIEEVVRSGPPGGCSAPLAEQLLWQFDLTRPFTVKLLHFGVDAGGLADHQLLADRLGARRHVVCRPHEEIHSGAAPTFAEVHELWWPTVREFERGAAKPALRPLLARPGSVTLLATAERFR